MTHSRGTRFIAAFNDIEDHFRSSLRADEHVEFIQLARDYADRRRLPRSQRDALAAFAALRNAISHGRYYGGRPIAEPIEDVVHQIEGLRDQLMRPPTALGVLGPREVKTVQPGDPIGVALEYVRTHEYSQLPVYSSEHIYQGLLTTNAIARWLADQLTTTGGLAESQPVQQVLRFVEPHEAGQLRPRSITVLDALHELTRGGQDGTPLTALIITANGRDNEAPLGMVVAADMPVLSAAVALP